MFEFELIEALQNDDLLSRHLSTYDGKPSIFSEYAPAPVKMPVIVFNIIRTSGYDNSSIQEFTIMVDYFDYQKARANSRIAAQQIEFILDFKTLQSERYTDIRLRFFSGGPIPEPDNLSIHYNLQFQARATRRAWMATII